MKCLKCGRTIKHAKGKTRQLQKCGRCRGWKGYYGGGETEWSWKNRGKK